MTAKKVAGWTKLAYGQVRFQLAWDQASPIFESFVGKAWAVMARQSNEIWAEMTKICDWIISASYTSLAIRSGEGIGLSGHRFETGSKVRNVRC